MDPTHSNDTKKEDEQESKNFSQERTDSLNEKNEDDSLANKSTNEASNESTNAESSSPVPVEPEIVLSAEENKIRLERSTDLKSEGNVHFKNEEYEKAIELYDRSFDELKDCSQVDDKRSIILNNKAVCRWKLLEKSQSSTQNGLNFKDENVKTEFEEIIKIFDKSIELNPEYFKPYLKRAELHHKFGGEKLDNSLEDYKKLLQIVPNDNRQLINDIKHEIFKLEKEIEQRNEQLKQEMFSKLKDLGNLCLKPFGLSTENFKLQQNENGGYSVNFQN